MVTTQEKRWDWLLPLPAKISHGKSFLVTTFYQQNSKLFVYETVQLFDTPLKRFVQFLVENVEEHTRKPKGSQFFEGQFKFWTNQNYNPCLSLKLLLWGNFVKGITRIWRFSDPPPHHTKLPVLLRPSQKCHKSVKPLPPTCVTSIMNSPMT